MKAPSHRLWVLLLVVSLALLTWWALGDRLSLVNLRAQLDGLRAAVAAEFWLYAAGFFALYVVSTALSLPFAAVLSLAGAAVFGFWWGLVLVSLASTLGATIAFLLARYLLADFVRGRWSGALRRIDQGVQREGVFYLFAIRNVPLIPFFMVNLLMGLTRMRVFTYFWVSWLGMFPATVIFVNAGVELASIQRLGDIFTPGLIVAVSLLGVFPLLARWGVNAIRRARLRRGFKRPARFDYNLVVIGAGAAGLVCANVAAALRAKVLLIERERMGGDCLYTGCVPSKALLRAARAVHAVRDGERFGVSAGEPSVDFSKVMAHVRQTIRRIEPHDSVERYQSLGVECRAGSARVVSPWWVEIAGEQLSARAIVIATGARPMVPPIPGLEQGSFLTTENLWRLEQLPVRLLVLGGGAVGCELAQAFARLGSEVTLVEQEDRVLPGADLALSDFLVAQLRKDGVQLRLGRCLQEVNPASRTATLTRDEATEHLRYDQLLVAVGRRPDWHELGLRELGIEPGERGELPVDDQLRTVHPNILACGDVTGRQQLTHAAGQQGWIAAVNALFGGWSPLKVKDDATPKVLYTEPEVAWVGPGAEELRQRETPFNLMELPLDEVDRALADGADEGFMRLLVSEDGGRILGAQVVAPHAGELITELAEAVRRGRPVRSLQTVLRPYPGYGDGLTRMAGNWRRAHSSPLLLKLAAIWWRRSRS